MARVLIIVALALLAAGCRQDNDTTGSIDNCPVRLAKNYNPRNLDQCVSACRSCDHGTVTTCTTSCRLKGAI